MRKYLLLLLLLFVPVKGRAQTNIQSGPTNPTHCNPAVGQLFFNNSTTPGLMYYCSGKDTWSIFGGGTPGGSSGTLQYNNVGTFGGLAASVVDTSNNALLSLTIASHLGVGQLTLGSTLTGAGASFIRVCTTATCDFSNYGRGIGFQEGANGATNLNWKNAAATNQLFLGVDLSDNLNWNQGAWKVDPSGNETTTSVTLPSLTSHASLATDSNGKIIAATGTPIIPTSFTTTAATSDNVTVTGMTSSGHCWLQPTNASADTLLTGTYVSAKTTDQITVTHSATGGATFDVGCTPN